VAKDWTTKENGLTVGFLKGTKAGRERGWCSDCKLPAAAGRLVDGIDLVIVNAPGAQMTVGPVQETKPDRHPTI
jgi:hypothetical protein